MARAEKFVPLEKRSKKEQKAYHAQQRGSWNGVNPVTRVVPNKKGYDRKRRDKGKKALPLPQEEVCRCAGKDAQRGHTEYMKDMMEYQYEE